MTHKSDEGSAFMVVIVMCCVCMIVSFGVAKLGFAVKSLADAQNAADAAALSAAYEIARSNSSNACGSARIAAQKNAATLTKCSFSSDEVVVEVQLNKNKDIRKQAKAEIE